MPFLPSQPDTDFEQSQTVVAVVVLAPHLGDRAVERDETVRSLRSQQRAPNLVVVVDTAAKTDPLDASAVRANLPGSNAPSDMEDTALPPIQNVHAPGARSFGEAVLAGLTQVSNLSQYDWLWLLHDDMVVAPDALTQMLQVGAGSRNIGAIGPKQVRYGDVEHLLEMGIDATATARRVYMIEPDEADQGQHDGREEVLAVGSGGALIRREAFQELGGLDPNLGPFGDGLEFGRRLWLSGYRVVVAPRAVVQHAQTSYGHDTKGRSSFSSRRSAQLYNWGLAVPTWQFVPYLLWLPLLTLIRSFSRLFSRNPSLAFSELAAYVMLVGNLPSMMRRRRHLRDITKVPRSALKELETPPALILKTRRSHRKIVIKGSDTEVSLDQGALDTLRRHRLRSSTSFWFLIGIAGLISAVVWYPYAAGIEGGVWGALPTRWQTLMAQAWSGWQVSGDGAFGPSAPILGPLSLLAAPFSLLGISPARVAQYILFAAFPLAAWGGWGVVSSFTRSNLVRLAGGALWAGSSVLAFVMMWGNLSALIVYLALPVVITGLLRGLRPPILLRASGVEEVVAVANPPRLAWIGLAGLASGAVVAAAPLMVLMLPLGALAIAGSASREQWREATAYGGAAPGKAAKAGATIAVFLPGLVLILPALITQVYRGSVQTVMDWLALPTLPFQGATAVLFAPGPLPVDVKQTIGSAALTGTFTILASALALLPGAVLLVWVLFSVYRSLRASSGSQDGRVVVGAFVAAALLLVVAALQAAFLPGFGEASLGLVASAMLSLVVSVSASHSSYALVVPSPHAVGNATGHWLRGAPATCAIAAALASTVMLVVLGPSGVLTAGQLGGGSTIAPQTDNVALQGLAAKPTSSSTDIEVTGEVEGGSGLRSLYVSRAPSPVIPMIAQEVQNGPRAGRLLTLAVSDGEVDAKLLRGAGLQLADFRNIGGVDLTNEQGDLAARDLASSVATLSAWPNQDVAQRLAEHAVDLVMLDGNSDELTQIQGVLDATPGLQKIGSVEGSELWRVRPGTTMPARVSIYPTDEASDAAAEDEPEVLNVPSGAAYVNTVVKSNGGMLVLAEVSNPAWSATFDGQELQAVQGPSGAGDWRQAFAIPAGEGTLLVRYDPGYLVYWWAGAALVLVVMALLAAPRGVRWRTLVPHLRGGNDE